MKSRSSKQPEETANDDVNTQDSLMHRKNDCESITDSDMGRDADRDVKSPGYSEAESITEKVMSSCSPEKVEQGSADELRLGSGEEVKNESDLPSMSGLSIVEDAAASKSINSPETDRDPTMKRIATAMRRYDDSGRQSVDDDGKTSRSLRWELMRSAGKEESFESAPASALEPAANNADETDLLDIVRRQWRLITAIVVVATIVGAVILSQLTPLYTANAEVIIEPQRPTLPALEAILPGAGTDEQSIETEVAVLTSGVLLDLVIDTLDLVSDPEFNSIAEPPEAVTAAESAGDRGSLQVPADRMRALTRNTLLSRLEVAQVGDSRVISIHATSESSDKAATIANTLVDEYFQSRRDSKFQVSSETSSWLEERIADLQAELRESEERAERFRSDAELLKAGGTTLISQQLVNLNGQIISARAATAAAQAELSQVGELMSSSDSSSILASAGVLQSPLVQELRKQQVALERQIAELSSEFGPAHPRMIQLRADAADLESQISIEVDKVVQGLRNSVKVAEAREADLEREAVILTARLGRTKEDEIQLRALERESEANQQLLETLLARRKALGSPDLMQTGQPDARVISFAAAPITPSFPQFGISMAGIFMVSTIIGFVVAFIREIRRQGISTLEQLEAVSKLRALGFVPHVTSRRQQREMLDSIVTKSRRPFAQAMKTLNWQLDESMPARAKAIVVTSSIPGEGKTTTAIAIARIKALKGHKTIIVDADIRNPAVHTRLNCQPASGLTDIIKGKSELADAIVFDSESPLEILPAGQASSDALGLVESSSMSFLLEGLRGQYDYIIIDSPPIAAAPDACILSKEADATILAVRCSTTPANAVQYALRVLKRNGGHITGTVLTMVEASYSLNRKYGYFGYYGYYGPKEQE